MDFALITAIALLLFVTFWLLKSARAQVGRFGVKSLLYPVSKVITYPLLDDLDLPAFQRTRHSESTRVEYVGVATLPRTVYEGDSQNLSIVLEPNLSIPATNIEPLLLKDIKDGKEITLQITEEGQHNQFLEIELIGAGFDIDGEKRQRQSLPSRTLSYRWSCYFPNSGSHALAILLRVVTQSEVVELGNIHHTIKVVKIDHMTQRQVWILASLTGILSGGLAIAEALHRLGAW